MEILAITAREGEGKLGFFLGVGRLEDPEKRLIQRKDRILIVENDGKRVKIERILQEELLSGALDGGEPHHRSSSHPIHKQNRRSSARMVLQPRLVLAIRQSSFGLFGIFLNTRAIIFF